MSNSPTLPGGQGVFLNTKQLADMLGLSTRTLERQRVDGSGAKYCKLGAGIRARVIYRLSDVQAWLDGQCVKSTAEHSVSWVVCGAV